MPPLNFNYSSGEAYAKKLGLVWMPDLVVDFDQQAAAHGFKQAQIDLCIQHHLHQVNWLFRPQNYTLLQRIKISLWFLLGRQS